MGIVVQRITLDSQCRDVWNFITKPENFPQYVYGYVDGKTISPNAVGIGARYVWYGKLGLFKLRSTEEIVDWQEQRRVAYTGKLFGVAFDSAMDVRETKPGQTILTVSITYKAPIYLGGKITEVILLRWMIRDYVKKSLDQLQIIFNT